MSMPDSRASIPKATPPAAPGSLAHGGHGTPADPGAPRGIASGSTKGRLLWFVGIYGVSLAAFTALVYSLRALIPG